MRKLIGFSCMIVLFFAVAPTCNALIIWNWDFGTETGQFITSGNLSGGIATSDTYTLTDFSVTATYDNRLLGSLSNGDYQDGSPGTSQAYTFYWDNSQAEVTQWNHQGSNTYDWWVFRNNNLAVHEYWFGWEEIVAFPFQNNDPKKAALIDKSVSAGGQWIKAEGLITVTPTTTTPAPIPEPSTMILLGTGFIGLAAWGRKKFKR